MFKLLVASVVGVAALDPKSAEDNAQHMKDIAAKSGATCFDSGLCVEAIKMGDRSGEAVSPLAGTSCEVHYTGQTIDGTQFDSSRARGSTIR